MISAEEQFRQAMAAHQTGHLAEALDAYTRILKTSPQHAGARHLLGVACHQAGRLDEALKHLADAVKLDGTKAVYHNNFGVALHASGRFSEAHAVLERAITLNPGYADAHSNLGLVLHCLLQLTSARQCYQRALDLNPLHLDALYNLANLLLEVGRSEEAIPLYRRALERQPQRPELHNNLGNALLASKQPEDAIACYEQALALQPEYAEARLNLGHALAASERVSEATSAYLEAAALRPERMLWAWLPLSLCPTVFDSVEELDAYRKSLEERLDARPTPTTRISPGEIEADGFSPPFNLSHHGRCNRRIKEKFAALFLPAIPHFAPVKRPGKPRIGFLTTSGHEGGMLRSVGGLIERLHERFQPVLLSSESAIANCRRRIQRTDVQWVPFPNRLLAAAKCIAEAGCDVLYHWQIGSDPLNYLLPLTQAARVQCTSWGTHVTSGMKVVNYYLSSELIEAERSDEHYTEHLVRLPTLPTFERRIASPTPAKRDEFNLPGVGNLYICPQRLAKLHPDFDPLLARILEQDPQGHLILLRSEHRYAMERLLHRFNRTLGRAAKRVLFLPSQTDVRFHRLLSLADVVLDPPHYSAGFTAYDAFALGIPLVTLPGELHISRYSLGCYRKMKLEELVPTTAQEYVNLAIQIAQEHDFQRYLRKKILERCDVLYSDNLAVTAMENWLDTVITNNSTQK